MMFAIAVATLAQAPGTAEAVTRAATLPNGNDVRPASTLAETVPAPSIAPIVDQPHRPGLQPPLARGRLTSTFGLRVDPLTGRAREHFGLDIAAPLGTDVFAAEQGLVRFAGHANGYGLLVEIAHLNRLETRYGHLSHLFVQLGQVVKRGQLIGLVGSTGRSTGSHLHFEVRVAGMPINPSRPLPRRSSSPIFVAAPVADVSAAVIGQPSFRWSPTVGHLPSSQLGPS